MTAAIGQFALSVALFGSAAAAWLWLRAARRPAADPVRGQARLAGWTAAGGAAAAVLALEWGLVRTDLSLAYVAAHSSATTPLLYRVTALWSAMDGSLLLWSTMLVGFGVAVGRAGAARAADPRLQAVASGVVAVVGTAFLAVTRFAAAPFAVLAPPADVGAGPDPLLADHPAMAVHPPLLYLGFVGLVVPFAYGIAALVVGDAGRAWLALTRGWVLVAWTALTAGILLGAWWSYAVLGWGGYWGWDPVENASLMPWLTTTALLHAALLQRRRAVAPWWTVSLAAASFLLVTAGTFLTRSGIVASVHSFTRSAIGPALLALLLAGVAAVVLLLVWRADTLRDPDTQRDPGTADAAAVPRPRPRAARTAEAALLANNVLLALLAAVLLLGTLLPVLLEATTGAALTVGAPYYDRMAIPVAFVLLVLLVLGPAAGWDGGGHRRLGGALLLPVVVGLATVAALGLSGVRGLLPVLALGLSAAVVAVAAQGLLRSRTLRARAGHVAHAGVALIAAGVAASSAWAVVTEASLVPGQRLTAGDTTVVLQGIERTTAAGRMRTAAHVSGAGSGVLTAALVYYPAREATVAVPGIASSWRGDTYLTLLSVDAAGSRADVRLAVEPMVGWIWIGGALCVLGGLLAGVGTARRRPDAASPRRAGDGDGAAATAPSPAVPLEPNQVPAEVPAGDVRP